MIMDAMPNGQGESFRNDPRTSVTINWCFIVRIIWFLDGPPFAK